MLACTIGSCTLSEDADTPVAAGKRNVSCFFGGGIIALAPAGPRRLFCAAVALLFALALAFGEDFPLGPLALAFVVDASACGSAFAAGPARARAMGAMARASEKVTTSLQREGT